MVFTTYVFIFYFLPLFLALYYSLPRRWRNLWITLASYVFYGWWEPWFVCLMLFTTVLDFIWGRVITRPGATRRQQQLAVAACVVTNLGFLGFFKYTMFAAETLNQLLALVGAEPFRVLQVVLPIGISFYTFHSLTYIIDCMLNLAIVMLLGGLWHGAKWNFLAWGAFHGLLLIGERWRGKTSLYSHLPRVLRVGLTFVLVLFSWVFFRADDLTAALHYFGALFGLTAVNPASVLLAAELYTPLHLLVIGLAAVSVFQPVQAHEWALQPQTWTRVASLLLLFALSLMVMFSQSFNPFLYFQF